MGNPWTWPPGQSATSILQTIYQQAPGLVPLSVPPALLNLPAGPTNTEFDQDPGWSYYAWTPTNGLKTFSGTPNWDARIAGVNPAISFTQRKSFVTLQPGDNNVSAFEAFYYFPTPITWVANSPVWYWSSGSVSYSYVQDERKLVGIFSNLAGVPDRQNLCACGWWDAGGGQQLVGLQYIAGTPTIINGSTPGAARAPGSYWQYVALYLKSAATRAGTVIECWVFNDAGEHMQVASVPFAALTATFFVGFFLRNAVAPATGFQPNILQADFWRESAGVTPPWVR